MKLLSSPIPAEHVLSRNLRIRLVDGDGLEPELVSRRDYVILAPVEAYCGEGIYLIDWGCGPVLYRVQSVGAGKVLIRLSNPLYRDNGYTFTKEQFNEMVLGFVVADVKVRDETMLRQMTEGAR